MKVKKASWAALILAAMTLIMGAQPVEAKYSQTSKVRYNVDYGHSKWYEVDVIFLTGSELDSATNSYKYGSFSEYAVIFWDEDRASVIKLQGIFGCGTEFKKSCFPAIGNIKGEDQGGRVWEICTSNYCL